METQVTENVNVETEVEPKVKAMSQKDAVHKYVTEALEGTEVTVAQLKDTAVKTAEKKAALKQARVNLFNGIKNGTIAMSKEKTDGELKKYCSSLINNWLGKDKRFA